MGNLGPDQFAAGHADAANAGLKGAHANAATNPAGGANQIHESLNVVDTACRSNGSLPQQASAGGVQYCQAA